MIKSVSLGEEIVITTKNKVGLLADVAMMLASEGVNIEAIIGYEVGNSAKLMMVTNANLVIINELKKKKYEVEEIEVVLVELENKPGALKVMATELKNSGIDIRHLYVTSGRSGDSSRAVLQTSDNETAIAVLTKYI